jgi:hypothetical protein
VGDGVVRRDPGRARVVTWTGGEPLMHDWVYIATPSGASIGRTVALAKGGGRS